MTRSTLLVLMWFLCFKKKTAYEMRISDCSSDVCSSDLSWAMFPRMAFSLVVVGADRIGHQLRAVLRHQPLHLRVGEEGAFGRGLALVALAFVARVPRFGGRLR